MEGLLWKHRLIMTSDEFDNLAIFVAVVEELRREPFFSEDNHDKLSGDTGIFCHPMFLKSAVLPFRKIWMASERCAFRKLDGKGGIRELVFREHPDKRLLQGYGSCFYDTFDSQLTTPVGNGWAKESKQEIINLWLNTQVAHTGPKNFAKKKAWESDLADFNKCDARIGREKFEFLFRSSIGTIGHFYILFEETLAFPLFKKLRDENGMKPSFEADVALKYNPYPDSKYKIIFDDVFWHLKRETEEETFFRLLARQQFGGLRAFLHALFPKSQEALGCICELDTLAALLKHFNVVILDNDAKPETRFLCRSNTNTGYAPGLQGRISFDAYEGRKIRFYDDTFEVLGGVYIKFRYVFLEERKRQRQPDKW
jgi:hypothetical protein